MCENGVYAVEMETYCLLWVNMSPFLRFNAETQRRREKEGVCLQSEGPSRFFGDRPRESIANRVSGCRQKFFQKKFVIGCHWVHTFNWLNLLLEPKRLLQRFGFVFLGDASFCGVSQKDQEKRKGGRMYVCRAKVRAKGYGVFAEGP